MIESELKIGVLSRRAPIGHTADLTATLEHVGGLTRVLPALAEFANIDWTALTTQSQEGLPRYYSFSEISNQVHQHDINIFLAEVDSKELDLSDWFCAHYIWPLLHGLPIPELADAELSHRLNTVRSTSQALAAESIDVDNHGYLVNDFQLSQVPVALRELEPSEQISFFLHTPWPKSVPSSNIATKILEFLASGMLAADVIQFQTQKDLRAFENFVITLTAYLAIGSLVFPKVLKFKIGKLQSLDLLEAIGTMALIYFFFQTLLRIIDYLSIVMEKKANETADFSDNQLVIFFREFLKVVVIILCILVIIRFVFNKDITKILAGLSLAGAAIALAAKESLENLIASFIIFFDKPFTVGDLLKVHQINGTVEKIGLRSTRIRTLEKTYVTIPNKQMVDSIVDNLTLRNKRRGESKPKTFQVKFGKMVSLFQREFHFFIEFHFDIRKNQLSGDK